MLYGYLIRSSGDWQAAKIKIKHLYSVWMRTNIQMAEQPFSKLANKTRVDDSYSPLAYSFSSRWKTSAMIVRASAIAFERQAWYVLKDYSTGVSGLSRKAALGAHSG